MKSNQIILELDGRKISIVQNFETTHSGSIVKATEILDITDGYGGSPVWFGASVESFRNSINKVLGKPLNQVQRDVKKALTVLNCTQRHLAKLMGVSDPQMSKWVRNGESMSLVKLQRLNDLTRESV